MSKPKYWDVKRAIKENVVDLSAKDMLSAFARSGLRQLQAIAIDSRYRAVDIDTWRLIMDYSNVDKKKYKSEHFDCDNFAVCFAGEVAQKWELNGVGIVIDVSAKHAYNCLLVVDNDNYLRILSIEPQTDRITSYVAEEGFVMFA